MRHSDIEKAKIRNLTFLLVQRFDLALCLNPHLHVLMLDGVLAASICPQLLRLNCFAVIEIALLRLGYA